MCAVISIDYSDLKDAKKAADKAADYCQDYAKELEKKVTRKLGDLKLGSNNNTSQASYFAKQKIKDLEAKKKKYEKFADKIDEVRTYAKEKDEAVSKYIKSESKEFREKHDMKTNALEEFFAWATTTLLNNTEFGRWLNEKMRDISNWVDDKMRGFKQWYHLEGGKYIIKTVLAVIGTVIAVVFLVCVAWPALAAAAGALAAGATLATVWTFVTAAAAFVTAIVAVVDSVTKVFANAAAVMVFEDDPGWARRYSSYTSFSEYLRKNNFHNGFLNKLSFIAANTIDVVATIASVINIADMFKQGFQFFRQVKTNGAYTIFRKVHFKSPNGKVTWGTFKYGLKSLFENIKAVKNGIGNTNISRIQNYFESSMKGYKTYKSIKTISKTGSNVDSWADKGTWDYALETIKDKLKGTFVLSDYGDKIKSLIDKIKSTKTKIKSTPSYV